MNKKDIKEIFEEMDENEFYLDRAERCLRILIKIPSLSDQTYFLSGVLWREMDKGYRMGFEDACK